jgi:hypothetical protein
LLSDSYDNALAETINGLYKAELIHCRASRKTKEAVELATLEWVSWTYGQGHTRKSWSSMATSVGSGNGRVPKGKGAPTPATGCTVSRAPKADAGDRLLLGRSASFTDASLR